MAAEAISRFRSFLSNLLFTYSTVKQIEVRNTYVGIIYRILQIIVMAYIIFYIVWIERGYQDSEEPRGSSVIKLKGVARVSASGSKFNANNNKQLLWDAAEYLIPPLENNAFFIATRKTVTYNQTQSTCPSAAVKDKLFCNSTHNPCKQGERPFSSFGFLTGNCVPSLNDIKKSVCEVTEWCPQELTNSTDYDINTDDLQQFTIFIKTIVAFIKYKIKIRTVKDDTDFSCRFNSDTHPNCPIFPMGYILENLQDKDSKIDLMALYREGGLIEILQTWKCNFDFAKQRKECSPTFTFNLLQSGSDKLSPGINYRFASKYIVNGSEYRTLTKVYGLRFVVSVQGEGRRFDIVHLFVAIGSGVGYMIIAEIICEFIFNTFHKHRRQYQQSKVKVFTLNQSKATDSKKLTASDDPQTRTTSDV